MITELPYQVNKARLIERIADLVREKKLEGISELRDESDKDGMRVVIELKRGELSDVVLNNLYKQTPLQSVFGINMVGLVDGQPRLLSLKELLDAFLRHRREVVTRRTLYDLRKARERAHVLEGLMVALANIDRSHRADQALAVAGRREDGALRDAIWPPGRRDADARARRRDRDAARGSRARSRASRPAGIGCRPPRRKPFSTCGCSG